MPSPETTPTVPSGPPQGQDVGNLLLRAGVFAVLFAAVWLCFYTVWSRLPYLEPGSEIIYQAKRRAVATETLLDPAAPCRVVMFGNSIALAGFIPGQFDRMVGGGCRSYNMGMPERNAFMAELKAMLDRGDAPTHILLQVPWPALERPETFRVKLKQDNRVMDLLFPFRKLPRDLAIFSVLGVKHGGFRDYYASKRKTVDQMLEDRGYYFIEGQSRFEGNRLPDTITFPIDRPDKVLRRRISTQSIAFRELEQLSRTFDMQILLVPEYYRTHYLAEPPARNERVAEALDPYPRFHALGPDYYRYENRYFSDAVHANRKGAERYTGQLAGLFADHIGRTVNPNQGSD